MAKTFIATRAQAAVIAAHEATSAANDFYRSTKLRPNRQQQLHELYTFLCARRLRTLESLTLPPIANNSIV